MSAWIFIIDAYFLIGALVVASGWRDAWERATFIYKPAPNKGWSWTRAGKAWIEGAGK